MIDKQYLSMRKKQQNNNKNANNILKTNRNSKRKMYSFFFERNYSYQLT